MRTTRITSLFFNSSDSFCQLLTQREADLRRTQKPVPDVGPLPDLHRGHVELWRWLGRHQEGQRRVLRSDGDDRDEEIAGQRRRNLEQGLDQLFALIFLALNAHLNEPKGSFTLQQKRGVFALGYLVLWTWKIFIRDKMVNTNVKTPFFRRIVNEP